MKFGPVVQEEMSFKEKVYGRRTKNDGQRTKTNHNTSPSALRSGELIKHVRDLRVIYPKYIFLIKTLQKIKVYSQ